MKTGVVLFNLGGPADLKSVQPFLFNLFSDPAILEVPFFTRLPLALLISTLRNTKARQIYAAIGGGSPLLQRTEDQARALEQALNGARAVVREPSGESTERMAQEFKCAIAMRYTAPRAKDAAAKLKKWGADKIIYLPMYPQYSASTTGSSFKDFDKTLETTAKTAVSRICCYPEMSGFTQALAALIKPAYEKLAIEARQKNLPAPRLLLSAHGLPEKMIEAGDPYAWQCEKSAYAVVQALGIPNLDWELCYQSRVGPLEWIKPYTEEEIRRAGASKTPLLIAPLAFTADNSETLYEIDQLYRDMALEQGAPLFASTPCVGTHPLFIEGLAGLVKQAANASKPVLCPQPPCPENFSKCACRNSVVE